MRGRAGVFGHDHVRVSLTEKNKSQEGFIGMPAPLCIRLGSSTTVLVRADRS